MLCVHVTRNNDGYILIRLTDATGFHTTYGGWDLQAILALLEEQQIDLR